MVYLNANYVNHFADGGNGALEINLGIENWCTWQLSKNQIQIKAAMVSINLALARYTPILPVSVIIVKLRSAIVVALREDPILI